ncbi:MAG: hypothetical protein E6L04_02525 [Thaumarchaeota archaeon]|nr:MAG: hypothetical protein E6L04_02525 [Nitrososphaerota archaeon]
MSTQEAPTKKRMPKLYTFNKREFKSIPELLNHLMSINLLTIKDRIIVCRYCGATLNPTFEGTHYWIKHPDKVQLK